VGAGQVGAKLATAEKITARKNFCGEIGMKFLTIPPRHRVPISLFCEKNFSKINFSPQNQKNSNNFGARRRVSHSNCG
jgi:hypothetical protein